MVRGQRGQLTANTNHVGGATTCTRSRAAALCNRDVHSVCVCVCYGRRQSCDKASLSHCARVGGYS